MKTLFFTLSMALLSSVSVFAQYYENPPTETENILRPATVYEVCNRIFDPTDKAECMDIGYSGSSNSLALGLCNEMYLAGNRTRCIETIVGKDYTDSQVYACQSQGNALNQMQCLRDTANQEQQTRLPRPHTSRRRAPRGRLTTITLLPNRTCIERMRRGQSIADLVSAAPHGTLLGQAAQCDRRRVIETDNRSLQIPRENCTLRGYGREIRGCMEEIMSKTDVPRHHRVNSLRIERLRRMCSTKILDCRVSTF